MLQKEENLIKIKTKVYSIVTIINVACGIRINNVELKKISVLYSCVLSTELLSQQIGN